MVEKTGIPSKQKQQATMIPSGHNSEGENVPEIQSLTARILALSRSVDLWNELMLWGLGLAAIAAVFVVIATRIVVTRTGQLAATQDLLSEAKDRHLQTDLKAKDVEIGNLKLRAAEFDFEAEKLRMQLAFQQRRGNILMDPHNRATFGNPLKRFRGQKFDVIACGVRESEIAYFSMAVWSTLQGSFAGWTLGKIENDSPSCQAGLVILTHPDAPVGTVEAAKELLNSFVRIKLERGGAQIGKIPPPPPDAGKTGVWYLAPSSVDSIVVMI
jgi:hypothetical protein